MSEDITIRRFDDGDGFGHVIEADCSLPLVVKITAYRVTSVDTDNNEVAERELLARGHIKWDECGDFFFGPCAEDDHNVYMHFCDRQQAQDLGLALARCYDVARELLGDTAIIGWVAPSPKESIT